VDDGRIRPLLVADRVDGVDGRPLEEVGRRLVAPFDPVADGDALAQSVAAFRQRDDLAAVDAVVVPEVTDLADEPSADEPDAEHGAILVVSGLVLSPRSGASGCGFRLRSRGLRWFPLRIGPGPDRGSRPSAGADPWAGAPGR